MKEEISKIATGQRRAFLIKLWEEDCNRNNEISQKRWEDKNAAWFDKFISTVEEFPKTKPNAILSVIQFLSPSAH